MRGKLPWYDNFNDSTLQVHADTIKKAQEAFIHQAHELYPKTAIVLHDDGKHKPARCMILQGVSLFDIHRLRVINLDTGSEKMIYIQHIKGVKS